jgi:DNA (cytosine-5)-methyltransferase 1
MRERHGDRPDTPVTEPAPTLTSKARSDVWVVDRRTNSKAAGGGMEPTVPVPMDRPAPTLTSKAGGQWVFRNGAQANATKRTMDAPAPTILASADNGDSAWVYERPATTVCADPRIAPPGYRTGEQRSLTPSVPSEQVQDGDYNGEAIKLTVREALILQSFRPDYPVQGTRSKKFEQIGNAIPPGLARAVLSVLSDPALNDEAVAEMDARIGPGPDAERGGR